MTTRISGLGSSGLDIDTIVKQSMQAKQIPIDQMKQKLTYLSWQRDAYRDMNTEVSSFLNEVQKLTLQTTFLAKKASLSTTDAGKVQVSPAANAMNGNFTLQVSQIAKNATITSSATLGVSANPSQAFAAANATLQVTGGLGTQAVSIASGDSVNQIVSKINATTSTTGVKAFYDQLSDKLTIANTQTGAAGNALSIVDQSATNLLSQLNISDTVTPNSNSTPNLNTTTQTNVIKGQDAIVNLNGTGNVTSASNSFALNNINFTLLADPGATPYTINGSVNSDVDTVVATIKGVFDKYNALIDKVNSKLSEPKYRDYPPLTDEQKSAMKDADITLWEDKAKSGLLRNDSILSNGLDRMRRFLSDSVSGIGAGLLNSLSQIGITTAPSTGSGSSQAYRENGKIYIDEAKLRDALTNSPDQVTTLFTKDGARDANGNLTTWTDAGIGTRLYEVVNKEIISGLTEKTQIIPTRSYLNIQLDDYTRRISDAQSGLSNYEQQLYTRYTNLETALTKLNSQSSYLASFFQKQ